MRIDPLELRRRNVVRDSDLPYAMATGWILDHMTAAGTLEQAARLIGYDGFRARQAGWRADGRLAGIGISLLAEPSAVSFGWFSTDAATVRVGLEGSVDVLTSAAGHGQSLESPRTGSKPPPATWSPPADASTSPATRPQASPSPMSRASPTST